MLGNSWKSLRAGGGGVWKHLAGCALQVRGPPSSGSAPSAESSGVGLSEHGSTDMETERPCATAAVVAGCRWLTGQLGEKTSASC